MTFESGPSFNEQLLTHIRSSAEKRFWYVNFVDAMQCLGVYKARKKENKYITEEDWKDTIEWVRDNSPEVAGFQWVCSLFGFNSDAVIYRLESLRCPVCDLRYIDQYDTCTK